MSRALLLTVALVLTAVIVPGQTGPVSDFVGPTAKVVAKVLDLANLPGTFEAAIVHGDGGRNGTFGFESGDFTARAASDPRSAIYVQARGTPIAQGAWVRQNAERPDARWFGASPTASHLQNSLALQAWLDFLVANKCHGYLPKGTYPFNLGLRISNGAVGFSGDGRITSILNYTGTSGDALTVGTGTGVDLSFVHLHDFGVISGTAGTSGAGLKLEISSEVIAERLFINGSFDGISAGDAHFYKLIDIRINGLGTGGRGVHIHSTGTGVGALECYLERVFVEGNASHALAPGFGFLVEDNQALFMDSCTAIYCDTGFMVNPDVASNRIEHLFFVNCLSDLNHGNGVFLRTDANETIRRVSWVGGWVSSNGASGIQIDGFAIESVTFDSIQIYNNGREGILAKTGSDLSITGCKIMGNSGVAAGTFSGIELGTAGGGQIIGAIIEGNRVGIGAGFANHMKWGAFLHPSSSRLIITGNDFLGNSLGGLNTTTMTSSLINNNLR